MRYKRESAIIISYRGVSGMFSHRFPLVAAIIGLVVCLFVAGAVASTEEVAQNAGLKRLIAVQEQNADELLAIEGVVGMAVGDGKLLVLAKAEEALDKIPDELDGIPVKTTVTGEIRALGLDPKSRLDRPVPTGVSTGNERGYSAGTIACRVTDGKYVYALSTNHVYALGNKAPVGSKILQPGLVDTDGEFYDENVIAELYDYSLIVFSDSPDTQNQIDAAIARCAEGAKSMGVASPEEGYGVPSRDTVEAELGMDVQKYGRSTSLTHGRIAGVNGIIEVRYHAGIARFVNQVLVESKEPEKRFVAQGDSGALLVTDDEEANPVGLLFAGNAEGNIAFANPIDRVLERFEVEIDNMPPGALADVAVTKVDAPVSVIADEAVDVRVTVENLGTHGVLEEVTVMLTDEGNGVSIGKETLSDGLAAGAREVLTFTWDTSGSSIGNHLLKATHTHADQESKNDFLSVPVTVNEAD